MEKLTIYTDGSCLSNPSGPGGFGAVILKDGVEEERISSGYKSTTNNRMELMAFMAALEAVSFIDETVPIEFISDSQYALNVISGKMNAAKNTDLIEPIQKMLAGREVSYTWVKGHNKDKWNEICDSLAFNAANGEHLMNDIGFTE